MRTGPLLLVAVLVSVPVIARAEDDDPTTLDARREFVEGTALVRAQRWGEALAAFERAAKLKPHAITTYNIAQCERAMGQYTRARKAFRAAIAQDAAAGGTQLSESVNEEARGLVAELDRVLSRVRITLKPEASWVSVDGRPLEATDDSALVAGTLPPAPGTPPPSDTFDVVLNPGVHVIVVSRHGYQDVIVNKAFAPGTAPPLVLELDRLPASIHVTSNIADAIVRLNGDDVGNPPVDVSRAAGRHRVVVTKKNFVTYESEFTVRPGERVDLAAELRKEDRPLTQKWWFWSAVGVVVVGAAVTTYFVVRSSEEPQRSATDGGGLGWSLRVP